MMFGRTKRLHFVGIGGSGMSGIAEILLTMGYTVTGSDISRSSTVERLEKAGAKVFLGHSEENVGEAQVVVISSAVSADNPEVLSAKSQLIPVIPRAEMLAELMRMKYAVAVAGSHGKTTTTSMVAEILTGGGLDPTIIIGGKVDRMGSGARLGESDYLVAEADESDGSFLKLFPTVAVVTNIDEEHIDHYGSFNRVKEAFCQFINKTPFYGAAAICIDDPAIQEIIPQLEKRFLTFGITSTADVTARDISFDGLNSTFTVVTNKKEIGRQTIAMPGLHNIYNALAAITVALELEMEPGKIIEALSGFSGIERRMQKMGEVGGVLTLDDYGHHPSEIKATLRAIREGFPGRRLVVAFQPHRYSRTRDLMGEFHTSFYDADELIVTEIYAASERPIAGLSGEAIAEGASAHGVKGIKFIPDLAGVLDHLVATLKEGDIALTLGAGDITTISGKLVKALSGKEEG